MEKLKIEGAEFDAVKIDMYGSALMIIKGSKGFLACGYINIETAEKLSHACAIVRGVKDFGDMLAAKVCAVSSAARALGVEEGISGAAALKILH